MFDFIRVYKVLREEHPEIERSIHFRSVSSHIANYGTIEDLKELNRYYEEENINEANKTTELETA